MIIEMIIEAITDAARAQRGRDGRGHGARQEHARLGERVVAAALPARHHHGRCPPLRTESPRRKLLGVTLQRRLAARSLKPAP